MITNVSSKSCVLKGMVSATTLFTLMMVIPMTLRVVPIGEPTMALLSKQ